MVATHAPRSPSASTSWKTQRGSRSHPATRPEAGSTRSRMPPAGAGPPCLEIGRQVRYRRAAVERWSTGSIQAGSLDENR